MPISERHTCTGKISKCDEIYIMGERRDTVDPEEPDKSVKTLRGYILASSPDKAAKPKVYGRVSSFIMRTYGVLIATVYREDTVGR